MALLKAFKAIRPVPELASKVAALPYDVINSEEARRMTKENPYSFLHIDKAEIDLPKDIDLYSEKVYEKAAENLKKYMDKEVLVKDKKDNLYIYQQIMGSHIQTGIVGCVSIDDYKRNIIKKHEKTREDKEKDRINHVKYCNANTGPIFLAYRERDDISIVIDNWITEHKPIYDFIAEDNIKHIVWVMDDDKIINELIEHFKSVDYLYIADGHHRAASAVKVGEMKRKENPDYNGMEEFNYFLGVLFPHNRLKIMDYNRVVKDLNNHTVEGFLEKVSENFYIEEYKGENGYKPDKRQSFGMYLQNKWYKLKAKESCCNQSNPTDCLDVSILQNNLLRPILEICDPRNDNRIDFIGGIRGLKELENRVNNGEAIAFSLYPTSMDEIMDIADNNETMPPKSTWFEPKLRSGLFVHSLD